ncbi:MAG: glycosyltransferase family 2 protein [Gemmatimonadota bacterium]|nr:glycosyltransferase family 2 protein [Gemmatimonadota bacterium]
MSGLIAVVIPALDAARTLEAVVRAARDALPLATVVVVDDGSSDDTPAIARAMADAVLTFDRNRGKGAALRAGIACALSRGADVVVTIDADGQHDPAAAPRLVAALDSADIALGTRQRAGSAMPLRRRITNALASAAVGAIAGASIGDSQSGFRAIRRRVLEEIRPLGDRYEYETDLLLRAARAGFRISGVPVTTVYGGAAASHFRGLSDTMRVVRTIWRHRAGAFR